MVDYPIKNMKPFEDRKKCSLFSKRQNNKEFHFRGRDKSLILAPTLTYLFRKRLEKMIQTSLLRKAESTEQLGDNITRQQ